MTAMAEGEAVITVDTMPAEGYSVTFDFAIDDRAMDLFQELSGDDSAIHTSDSFSRANGFRERIVYGGLLLTQLSRCLGTRLPGRNGVSASWSIEYRKPVYVNEPMTFKALVEQRSEATRTLQLAFTISGADGKLRAKGKVLSMVLGGREAGS